MGHLFLHTESDSPKNLQHPTLEYHPETLILMKTSSESLEQPLGTIAIYILDNILSRVEYIVGYDIKYLINLLLSHCYIKSCRDIYNKILTKKFICLAKLGIEKLLAEKYIRLIKYLDIQNCTIDLDYSKLKYVRQSFIQTCIIWRPNNVYDVMYSKNNTLKYSYDNIESLTKFLINNACYKIKVYIMCEVPVLLPINVCDKLIISLSTRISQESIFNMANWLSNGIIDKLVTSRLTDNHPIEDSRILKYRCNISHIDKVSHLYSIFSIDNLNLITAPNCKYIINTTLDKIQPIIVNIPIHLKIISSNITVLQNTLKLFPKLLSCYIQWYNSSILDLKRVKIPLSVTHLTINSSMIHSLDVFLDNNTHITSLKIRNTEQPLYDLLKNNRSLTHIDAHDGDSRIAKLCISPSVKSATKI